MKTIEFTIPFGEEICSRTLDAIEQVCGKSVKADDCIKKPLSNDDYLCAHNTYYVKEKDNG